DERGPGEEAARRIAMLVTQPAGYVASFHCRAASAGCTSVWSSARATAGLSSRTVTRLSKAYASRSPCGLVDEDEPCAWTTSLSCGHPAFSNVRATASARRSDRSSLSV